MKFDPHHLAALSAVLRLGSFDAAAGELSVTPSAISQRIKALENRVGAALVRRGSPCTGTALGARLVRHAEDVALLELQLGRELAPDPSADPAHVRIAVNADSLATWFVAALAGMDNILFDLVIDDQDHSIDWLRRGDVNVAITAQEKPVAGCDAWSLGALRYLPTASPAFMSRWFADGVSAEALAEARCLTFNAKDMLQRRWIETTIGKRLCPPAHSIPSTHAFIDAARLGLGWGMNPERLLAPYLSDGSLRPLVADAPLDVPLTLQVSRIMAPALAPLIRAIRAAGEDGLVR
jgi:LysR family transcriptional regulator (chromosome initiation inhibitor)